MSIQVQNVSKFYGTQKALDNISFNIHEGELVGFLGPNGAGKSTTMKILTCYIPYSSGKVKVCGFNTEDQSLEIRKNIGYLPEHNPLYLEMYIKEYLLFVASLHKLPNKIERVKDVINLVGLQPEKEKKIGALSKGYRQRVGLAQAIIHDPKVLILDEPTSGLDPNQIIEIRELIKSLSKNKAILMSTHIMQEAEALCDRFIIIHKGKIMADGQKDMIKKSTNEKISIYVEFSNSIDVPLLQSLAEIESVEKIEKNIFNIVAKSDTDIRKDIFDFAVQQKVQVLEIKRKEQDIEMVFKELTNTKKQ